MSTPASSSTDRFSKTLPPFFVAYDPDSPSFVAKAILGSTVLGSIIGASSAFHANSNPTYSAIQTGRAYFLLSTAFFGAREYLISPALLAAEVTSGHATRYHDLSEKRKGKLPEGPSSIQEMTHQRVLDSSIAGGLSFGTYSYFTRGARVVPRAVLTAGIMGAGLQYLVNATRVARLRLLASKDDEEPEEPIVSLAEQLRYSHHNTTSTMEGVKGDDTLAGRIMNIMTYVAPVKKVSREQVYDLLLEQRKRINRRLEQIEAEENRIFEEVQRRDREREMSNVTM